MPRNYVRKTNRPMTDPMVLIHCARTVLIDGKQARSVAKEYNVNYRTLLRFCSKPNITEIINNGETKHGYKRRNQIFSNDEEVLLIDLLVKSFTAPCDLSPKKIRQFAYEFAKTKLKTIPPSWENNKQAGPDWLFYFMKRHSNFVTQRNFLLGRDDVIKTDKSVRNCFEIEYMDLSFPMVDPLQEDTFEGSEDLKTEKEDDKGDEFSNNEKSEFSQDPMIVVKTELDDSFLSNELEASPSSNSNETYSPFKISTIILENYSNETGDGALNDVHSIILPSSWSITELPADQLYQFCLTFIVTTTKDNIINSVIEKCVFIDVKRQLIFKARNVTLDSQRLKLPKVLDDLKTLPKILTYFQSLRTCKGMMNMESFLLKEFPVIKDCLQTWRHEKCMMLLLKDGRCEFCSQLFQMMQEKIAKFIDPKFSS